MKKQKCSGGKRCRALAGWALAVLAALSLTLFMSGCYKGTDPRLPEEYYGTSWECADPYAVFDVDAEGNCIGTLVFEDVTLSIEVAFRENLSRRSGATQFFVHDEGPDYHLFNGEFKVTGDTMVITGTWSEFMNTIYHQSYDPGECTLIFERK